MTSVVQCEFCPDPIFGFPPISPGVSNESNELVKLDIDAKRHELERASVSRLSRVLDAIPSLKSLYQSCRHESWDGRDARPIFDQAFIEAEQLISQIPEKYPMPEIIPEVTGEIGLEWYINPYRVLLLSVAGDGYVYFAALYGFKDSEHGSKKLTGTLNKKIQSLLGELYKA